jgi:hypothetical protein
MKKIQYKEFKRIIEAQYETRKVEFKGPYKWGKKANISAIQATTIKSLIALSNLFLGGVLIIGIKQKGKEFGEVGLSKEEFESFNDYDQIKGVVDGYVYTNTNFNMQYTKNLENRYFVLFRVAGFNDYPLVCKKNLLVNGNLFLERDAIYVRGKSSGASSDKASYQELKEIIDISVKKVFRYWYPDEYKVTKDISRTEREKYNKQIRDIKNGKI